MCYRAVVGLEMAELGRGDLVHYRRSLCCGGPVTKVSLGAPRLPELAAFAGRSLDAVDG